ncbi:MAG: hypothetical protein EOP00_07900 [Pedobacter sp.]|nr:MAG: hypothetical protein EOP00_07900 [Pedobacter sp.]
MNSFLDKETEVLNANTEGSQNPIKNYFPIVFHVSIALLIVVTLFFMNVLSDEKISFLISDISFQFFSTLLLTIISLLNPFTTFSTTTHQKMLDFSQSTKNPIITWLLQGKNYQLAKAMACLAVITYFVYSGYLKLPSLDNGYLSGATIFLIFFYLFNNLLQLFKNPKQFRNANILRLSLLANSLKLSFFILIGVVVLVYIPSAILDLEFQDHTDPMLFALLAYNLIMANNELKVLRVVKKNLK